jgi:DNA modification methylase
VLKPSGHLYAFFGPKLWQQTIDLWKNGGFDVRGIICVWVKTGGSTGTVNWDFDFAPSWEPFIFAHNGERRLSRKRDSVFSYPPDRGSDRFHANQKPNDLIEELIELSSDEGELVFDPFGGSGATAIAAARKNRRYLTFEQSDVYFNIIKERLINLNVGSPNANDQSLPDDNETPDPSDMEEDTSEISNSGNT